jgi:hypothetical protein
MQYSTRGRVPTACGKTKLALGTILHMLSRLSALALTVLSVLPLAGCAESVATVESNQRFTELMKPYDKTLTKAQQKEAISELQNAQVKGDEADAAEGEATAAEAASGTN